MPQNQNALHFHTKTVSNTRKLVNPNRNRINKGRCSYRKANIIDKPQFYLVRQMNSNILDKIHIYSIFFINLLDAETKCCNIKREWTNGAIVTSLPMRQSSPLSTFFYQCKYFPINFMSTPHSRRRRRPRQENVQLHQSIQMIDRKNALPHNKCNRHNGFPLTLANASSGPFRHSQVLIEPANVDTRPIVL